MTSRCPYWLNKGLPSADQCILSVEHSDNHVFMFHPYADDSINHPPHYAEHPSGVECITVTEHMNFCRGNAMKYLWRAGEKPGASELDDLKKARWYLDREIARLEAV